MKYKNEVPFRINEFVEYADQLDDTNRIHKLPNGTLVTEKEWITQFYAEYHKADFYNLNDHIIKDEEIRKEAIRNKNSIDRDDALHKAYRSGTADDYEEHRQLFETTEFMDSVSNENELHNVLLEQGLEGAMRHLMNQCLENLDNKYLTKHFTLSQFYIKMRKLYKLYTKEKR